jgi:cell division protein FtsL
MSNLAKKIQQEIQQQPISTPKHKPKAPKKYYSLTPGERVLIFAFGVMVCIGGSFMVSKQAAIYDVNKEIQLVENGIQEQQKVNSDLEIQISELSTYERIKQQAEKLGLTFNEDNVKVVREQ